jgi:hypothetical protein
VFILPSLFLFQPWEFDNTKLFIYWFLFTAILESLFLVFLINTKKLENIFLAIYLIASLTFAGFLDVSRLFYSTAISPLPDTKYEVYSPQAQRVGDFVKDNTPKNSLFLSVDKFDNPVLALAGRKTIVGYHGWLWTYGLDFTSQDIDIKKMLGGQADAKELLVKYKVNYVIFFQDSTDYIINKQFYEENFKLIYNQDGYQIYQIK